MYKSPQLIFKFVEESKENQGKKNRIDTGRGEGERVLNYTEKTYNLTKKSNIGVFLNNWLHNWNFNKIWNQNWALSTNK